MRTYQYTEWRQTKKEIALTFDISYNEGNVDKILDVLINMM